MQALTLPDLKVPNPSTSSPISPNSIEIIQQIRKIEPKFTTEALKHILIFAKGQCAKICSDNLFQFPKNYQGLAHSIFINSVESAVYIPLKRRLVDQGPNNQVKECIKVVAGHVFLIAKISRHTGFLESEKRENPHWQIRKEWNAALGQDEIKLLKQLRGKSNVLHLHDGCLYTGSSKKEPVDKLVMFTDLYRCNLAKALHEHVLGKLDEHEKMEIIYSVAKGLSAIHGVNIVHKDIKLENILLTRSNGLKVVIGDFGLSRYVNVTNPQLDGAGTMIAWSPEIVAKMIENTPLHTPSEFGVDLWALGVLIHELCLGQLEWEKLISDMFRFYLSIDRQKHSLDKDDPLFDEKLHAIRERENLLKICFQRFQTLIRDHEQEKIDPKNVISVLLQRLWKINSSQRLSAQEVVDMLEPIVMDKRM